MHGIAKRGLALVAATSGIILGGAAIATADAGAVTTATTSHSGGAVAGWVAQAPVNIPVNVCGNSVEALAFKEMVHGTTCTNNHPGATATATTTKSGGIGAGNTVQAAGNVPVNVCGNTVAGAAVKNDYAGSTCTNNASGPGAAATSSVDHSREEPLRGPDLHQLTRHPRCQGNRAPAPRIRAGARRFRRPIASVESSRTRIARHGTVTRSGGAIASAFLGKTTP